MLPEEALLAVQKPARYLGGELNAVSRPPGEIRIRLALCFPDIYDVGMSHVGSQILYHVVNSRPGFACERIYCPWPDALEELRCRELPLTSLESGLPLSAFDVVGFTLQHELNYTTILAMLDLGGVPLRYSQRGGEAPLVIAGGPGTANPEPLAEFFEAFVLGDGEEALPEILEAIAGSPWHDTRSESDRAALLRRLAQMEGVYVPCLYAVEETPEGLLCPTPRGEAPSSVRRRVLADLDSAPYPLAPVVPWVETVHDRAQLEIARGCTRGCRFCSAGMLYRPVRERSLETLRRQARAIIDATGWDEISLTALNCPDYLRIEELLDALHADFSAESVAIGLASLRTDTFSVGLAQKLQRVRKTGLTFAPEAGTERLRRIINKGVTEEDLFAAAGAAASAGWRRLKLYFMLGLPFEQDEDLVGIADLCARLRRELHMELAVSVATFIPKPHTPFQWFTPPPMAELQRRQELLRVEMPRKGIKLSLHSAETAVVEQLLARGDRRLGTILEKVYRQGGYLEAWSEHFSLARWEEACAAVGVDLQGESSRPWQPGQRLPWTHLDWGVTQNFLRREWELAAEGIATPDCREGVCHACGLERLAPCLPGGEQDV
jgi:radical SAM family uncharacterized protein